MAVHAAITSTFYLCLFWILFFSLHLSKSFFVSFFHRLWTWSFGITGCSRKVHPLCWPAAGKVINKPLKICWSQWAQPTWSTIGNQNDCFLFYSIQLFISNNHSPCIHTTDRCKFSMTGFLDFFEQKLEFCSTLCRLISAFVESFLPFLPLLCSLVDSCCTGQPQTLYWFITELFGHGTERQNLPGTKCLLQCLGTFFGQRAKVWPSIWRRRGKQNGLNLWVDAECVLCDIIHNNYL